MIATALGDCFPGMDQLFKLEISDLIFSRRSRTSR
jgi:hypothetical protein